jgi:methionyl-tRNA synthetase
MEAVEVRKAAQELRAIWVAGNEYLQSAAPWAAFKEDPERAAAIVRFSLNLIPFYAALSAPFIPDAAGAMAASLPEGPSGWPDDVAAALTALPPGSALRVPDNLFRKLTDEDVAAWKEKYAGVRG